MTESEFWNMIHVSFLPGRDDEDGLEHLESLLEKISRDKVLDFQHVFNSVMARAYSWNLICGAYFLGCGQSDDGFEDFRAWLISRGQRAFESILGDPNLLAKLPFDISPTEEWYFEELHMLAGEIGGEEDDSDWPYSLDPDEPHGEELARDKDALRRHFPTLWNKFGDEFMIGVG